MYEFIGTVEQTECKSAHTEEPQTSRTGGVNAATSRMDIFSFKPHRLELTDVGDFSDELM